MSFSSLYKNEIRGIMEEKTEKGDKRRLYEDFCICITPV